MNEEGGSFAVIDSMQSAHHKLVCNCLKLSIFKESHMDFKGNRGESLVANRA